MNIYVELSLLIKLGGREQDEELPTVRSAVQEVRAEIDELKAEYSKMRALSQSRYKTSPLVNAWCRLLQTLYGFYTLLLQQCIVSALIRRVEIDA